MAIQIPNPGTGNGATGDNEFVLWSKVKDNFNDQNNAASRLVGTAANNLMQVGAFGLGLPANNTESLTTSSDVHTLKNGFYANTAVDGAPLNTPDVSGRYAILKSGSIHAGFVLATKAGQDGVLHLKTQGFNSTWGTWSVLYSTKNTTVEDGTNYLKVASPILRLQHGDFIKEHEAEKMEIVVDNPSTGVYKISGTTGLRNDGTWYFSPPKDEHNNVLCMVEVSEENDVITVNTYKKMFDFETVSIIPDYEQPTDIPEGATVMLRFNDLPAEPLPEV